MSQRAPGIAKSIYPQPGTHADRVLTYIKANPGTTKNAIIEALDLNPSVVRDIMRTMLRKSLVDDKPDDKQCHHFTAKSVL